MDRRSNELWRDAQNYDDWELSRPLLFRPDMRQAFFHWFRIAPGSRVLDGGCGTGVLTRFIAGGLEDGFVTGFDLSPHFVAYGNERIREEGLWERARIVQEDGFALSFEDGSFDAVVNHTYLGVLSDPEAGLRELVRVCKAGGRVSASIATRDAPSTAWAGEAPFAGEAALGRLRERHEAAYRAIYNAGALRQSELWNPARYPVLFERCGLRDVSIHPYASGFAPSDGQWTEPFRMRQIDDQTAREAAALKAQQSDARFSQNGFADADFDALIALLDEKREHLYQEMKGGGWSWSAKLHYVVSGTKYL